MRIEDINEVNVKNNEVVMEKLAEIKAEDIYEDH